MVRTSTVPPETCRDSIRNSVKAEIAMACSEDVLVWIVYSYLNSCLIFLVDEFLSDEQVIGLYQPYTAGDRVSSLDLGRQPHQSPFRCLMGNNLKQTGQEQSPELSGPRCVMGSEWVNVLASTDYKTWRDWSKRVYQSYEHQFFFPEANHPNALLYLAVLLLPPFSSPNSSSCYLLC